MAASFKKFPYNSLRISHNFRACYLSRQPHMSSFDYVASLCLISNRLTPERRAPCLFGRRLFCNIATLYFLFTPPPSLIALPKIQETVCQLWIPVRKSMFLTGTVFYFQPPGLAVSYFIMSGDFTPDYGGQWLRLGIYRTVLPLSIFMVQLNILFCFLYFFMLSWSVSWWLGTSNLIGITSD